MVLHIYGVVHVVRDFEENMRILVFVLCIFVGFGCNKPQPIPSVITSNDNGKTFSVKKGENISLSLSVNPDEDYFWAFSLMDGDFEVVSDKRKGQTQTFIVKVNSSGVLKLQYCKFGDQLNVLSENTFKVVVQ